MFVAPKGACFQQIHLICLIVHHAGVKNDECWLEKTVFSELENGPIFWEGI